tara:strand:+ start:147 stop:290 length:144 start_codon:yes stop_codon:yes gene_type:complete
VKSIVEKSSDINPQQTFFRKYTDWLSRLNFAGKRGRVQQIKKDVSKM